MIKRFIFTIVSSLIMLEMLLVDFIFMGDKGAFLFKFFAVTFISWIWLGISKFIMVNVKKDFKKIDILAEEIVFFLILSYLALLVIYLICFFQNDDFVKRIASLTMSCSIIEGMNVLLCIKSYKRWKKTKNKYDLLLLWPFEKK